MPDSAPCRLIAAGSASGRAGSRGARSARGAAPEAPLTRPARSRSCRGAGGRDAWWWRGVISYADSGSLLPFRFCSSGRRAGPIRPGSPPTSAAGSAKRSSRRGPRSCGASRTAPSARVRRTTARSRRSLPRSPTPRQGGAGGGRRQHAPGPRRRPAPVRRSGRGPGHTRKTTAAGSAASASTSRALAGAQ